MANSRHPNREIRQALILLTDALSDWKRDTGEESVLILRAAGKFVYRVVNGKNVLDDVEDADLLKLVEDK